MMYMLGLSSIRSLLLFITAFVQLKRSSRFLALLRES
jgi:hypothetical protein